MSRRSATLLLEDMLEAIAKIKKYTAPLDKEGFISGEMAADAVVRNLEIVGEAASRIPEEFRDQHPNIEWRKIIGLRHRIVHDYFGVDLEIIWIILQDDLCRLEEQIRTIHT